MSEIKILLKNKQNQLLDIIKQTKNSLKNVPPGRLSIHKHGEAPQYYHYINDDKKGAYKRQYIKKSNIALAKALAQKDYDKKLLHTAEKQLSQITSFLNNYDESSLSDVYGHLSISRKTLVDPLIPDDAEYVRRWESLPPSPFFLEDSTIEIYTEKGERVRSKSEKILADQFYKLHIPYRYESVLSLNNSQTFRPDFLLLNVRTREEYYWEHVGMMDNSGYVENFVRKISVYINNGIIPGKNLILTFETSKYPLNMKTVESLIREYLL